MHFTNLKGFSVMGVCITYAVDSMDREDVNNILIIFFSLTLSDYVPDNGMRLSSKYLFTLSLNCSFWYTQMIFATICKKHNFKGNCEYFLKF